MNKFYLSFYHLVMVIFFVSCQEKKCTLNDYSADFKSKIPEIGRIDISSICDTMLINKIEQIDNNVFKSSPLAHKDCYFSVHIDYSICNYNFVLSLYKFSENDFSLSINGIGVSFNKSFTSEEEFLKSKYGVSLGENNTKKKLNFNNFNISSIE